MKSHTFYKPTTIRHRKEPEFIAKGIIPSVGRMTGRVIDLGIITATTEALAIHKASLKLARMRYPGATVTITPKPVHAAPVQLASLGGTRSEILARSEAAARVVANIQAAKRAEQEKIEAAKRVAEEQAAFTRKIGMSKQSRKWLAEPSAK